MFKKITRKYLEEFLERHKSNERTLDIGAGGSLYGTYFPNRVTVDIDPARKPDIVADAHKLPFPDNEFKVVLSTEMLEHVKDPFQVERELRRVTKPGGTLILSTRFVFPIHDAPHDYWRYTKYGLQELFKEWEILELMPETHTFSALGALVQRVSFQSRLRFNKIAKIVLLLSAWLLDRLNFFILQEFGDIGHRQIEEDILATGYYLVCRKRG